MQVQARSRPVEADGRGRGDARGCTTEAQGRPTSARGKYWERASPEPQQQQHQQLLRGCRAGGGEVEASRGPWTGAGARGRGDARGCRTEAQGRPTWPRAKYWQRATPEPQQQQRHAPPPCGGRRERIPARRRLGRGRRGRPRAWRPTFRQVWSGVQRPIHTAYFLCVWRQHTRPFACGALRHESLRLTQTPCGGRRAPRGGARKGMRGRWCTPQPRLRPPHNPSGGSDSPACGPPHLRGAFFTSTAFTRRKREFGGRFINSPFGAQGAGGRDAVAFWPLGRSREMWPGARRGLLWLSPQRAPREASSARRTTFRAAPECSRSHRARAF